MRVWQAVHRVDTLRNGLLVGAFKLLRNDPRFQRVQTRLNGKRCGHVGATTGPQWKRARPLASGHGRQMVDARIGRRCRCCCETAHRSFFGRRFSREPFEIQQANVHTQKTRGELCQTSGQCLLTKVASSSKKKKSRSIQVFYILRVPSR